MVQNLTQHLTRPRGWRARMSAEIERHRAEPFAWGQRDCALGLAAGVVEAITGVDLRGDWGGYRTAAGAALALRRAGYTCLGDAVADLLPEIHPSAAQLGDIALIEEGPIGALAVVNGGTLLVLTETGLGVRERAAATRAFRVG
ncbi:hypothetical protein SAMN05877809_105296 [Rhodobacter sp. JA431]|uniref:DUF6950 family protein n=1 Tax=Rhodobacter sp. JA431 TaxID=570013 RepID=UPI000BCFDAF0|nr:hypothetical protein [Rhodobacter sp. JA431]SOC11478.1 hypothetical protein SAMN05877809_105296 [Rhodobacter sp. JA431]